MNVYRWYLFLADEARRIAANIAKLPLRHTRYGSTINGV
jgi:hypothetical protein